MVTESDSQKTLSESEDNLPPPQKRMRLSIDLTPYPDVMRMLERLKRDRRGVRPTALVIEIFRRDLTRLGYARKKDSQLKEAAWGEFL